VKAFFDSNILVYAYSTDKKRDRAAEVIALGGVINVQVLNEFANVLRNKQKISWLLIEAALVTVNSLFEEVRPLTQKIHTTAIPLARDHNINFYDALIIAAAQDAGCDLLFSEDLQHRRVFGRLEVYNPF
jgi:predicted nucleic acid-binding protein